MCVECTKANCDMITPTCKCNRHDESLFIVMSTSKNTIIDVGKNTITEKAFMQYTCKSGLCTHFFVDCTHEPVRLHVSVMLLTPSVHTTSHCALSLVPTPLLLQNCTKNNIKIMNKDVRMAVPNPKKRDALMAVVKDGNIAVVLLSLYPCLTFVHA